MKVLLDTCVWGGVKAELQAGGHDVLWTGDLAQDPGDEDILAWAHGEQRVLITLDKDFGNWQSGVACRTLASCAWSTSLPASRALCASTCWRNMWMN